MTLSICGMISSKDINSTELQINSLTFINVYIFNEILGKAFVKKNIPPALYRRFDPYVFTFNLETETVSKLISSKRG